MIDTFQTLCTLNRTNVYRIFVFFSEILSGVCFNNNNNKKEDERKNKGKWKEGNRLTNYFCYSIVVIYKVVHNIQGNVNFKIDI